MHIATLLTLAVPLVAASPFGFNPFPSQKSKPNPGNPATATITETQFITLQPKTFTIQDPFPTGGFPGKGGPGLPKTITIQGPAQTTITVHGPGPFPTGGPVFPPGGFNHTVTLPPVTIEPHPITFTLEPITITRIFTEVTTTEIGATATETVTVTAGAKQGGPHGPGGHF